MSPLRGARLWATAPSFFTESRAGPTGSQKREPDGPSPRTGPLGAHGPRRHRLRRRGRGLPPALSTALSSTQPEPRVGLQLGAEPPASMGRGHTHVPWGAPPPTLCQSFGAEVPAVGEGPGPPTHGCAGAAFSPGREHGGWSWSSRGCAGGSRPGHAAVHSRGWPRGQRASLGDGSGSSWEEHVVSEAPRRRAWTANPADQRGSETGLGPLPPLLSEPGGLRCYGHSGLGPQVTALMRCGPPGNWLCP